jgi:hypothetical protein
VYEEDELTVVGREEQALASPLDSLEAPALQRGERGS